MVQSPMRSRISGAKPLPSMTPSTAIMAMRKATGRATGRPSMAAAVVADMAPSIQARGTVSS